MKKMIATANLGKVPLTEENQFLVAVIFLYHLHTGGCPFEAAQWPDAGTQFDSMPVVTPPAVTAHMEDCVVIPESSLSPSLGTRDFNQSGGTAEFPERSTRRRKRKRSPESLEERKARFREARLREAQAVLPPLGSRLREPHEEQAPPYRDPDPEKQRKQFCDILKLFDKEIPKSYEGDSQSWHKFLFRRLNNIIANLGEYRHALEIAPFQILFEKTGALSIAYSSIREDCISFIRNHSTYDRSVLLRMNSLSAKLLYAGEDWIRVCDCVMDFNEMELLRSRSFSSFKRVSEAYFLEINASFRISREQNFFAQLNGYKSFTPKLLRTFLSDHLSPLKRPPTHDDESVKDDYGVYFSISFNNLSEREQIAAVQKTCELIACAKEMKLKEMKLSGSHQNTLNYLTLFYKGSMLSGQPSDITV